MVIFSVFSRSAIATIPSPSAHHPYGWWHTSARVATRREFGLSDGGDASEPSAPAPDEAAQLLGIAAGPVGQLLTGHLGDRPRRLVVRIRLGGRADPIAARVGRSQPPGP